jgi:hypothetical protein
METNMKKVTLTNEELDYLDNLIMVINRKLGLIKDDEGGEEEMDGGIRGLLFIIQANLTYPESEVHFTHDDGSIEVRESTVEFSNDEIFFIMKILEDEAFKNKKSSKKVIDKMIKKFERVRPAFIGE